MENALVPIQDIERMGMAIAKSGLFGMKTPEQAVALMLIAQAEGMHPAIAARDYHVIQGRPALKADAMLARFQAAGGRVEWNEYTDKVVSATFTHQSGGSVKIDWTIERAKAAGLIGKENWEKYPRQMLRARVISEGIRTVYPGISVGIYTPEEVQDFAQNNEQQAHADINTVEIASPVEDREVIDKPIQQPVITQQKNITENTGDKEPPRQEQTIRGIVREVTAPFPDAKYKLYKIRLDDNTTLGTYEQKAGEEIARYIGCEVEFPFTVTAKGNKVFKEFKFVGGNPLPF